MRRIRMWGLLAVFLLAASAPAAAVVSIDAANFPDAKFRDHVTANWDSDDNGTLSDAEIAAVDSADVSNKDIQSLKGIEHFTALKELICIDNQLTSLDVSKNKHLKSLNCQKKPPHVPRSAGAELTVQCRCGRAGAGRSEGPEDRERVCRRPRHVPPLRGSVRQGESPRRPGRQHGPCRQLRFRERQGLL